MATPIFVQSPTPNASTSGIIQESPRSSKSLEAFPEIQSSPTLESSPTSQYGSNKPQSHLEVPGASFQSQFPTRLVRSPSQRLPPTALLGSGRNGSHSDLTSLTNDYRNEREEQPQQRLPRALPAPSLSGPSVRPSSSTAPGLLRTATAVSRGQQNADELKSESLWADMQRTLADVELSAMKSSHLFDAKHSQALERLRETQLALAQAWARSESVEVGGGRESEEESFESETEGSIQIGTPALRPGGLESLGPAKGSKDGKGGKSTVPETKAADGKSGQGSIGSNVGKDLEEETEKDIKMSRKRREANDRYFSQVNRGVLDVVARLDDVASAMRMVERESRAVWEEMEGSDSQLGSSSDLDGDIDSDEKSKSPVMRESTKVTKATAAGAGSGTETGDNTTSPRSAGNKPRQNEKSKDAKTPARGKGR